MRQNIFIIVLFGMLLVHLHLLYCNNKSLNVNTCSAVLFCLIVYYDLIPILVFWGIKGDIYSTYQPFIELISSTTYGLFFYAEICILFFTYSFYWFYQSYFHSNNTKSYFLDENKFVSLISFFSWAIFIIGSISLILYIEAFGGLSTFFSSSAYIRTFRTDNQDLLGRAVILLVPARMTVVSPILFYALYSYHTKYRFLFLFFFLLSFVFAAIFLVFNSGKTGLITFSIIFFITIAKRHIKHPWKFSLVLSLFLIPMLGILDSFFSYLSTNVWVDNSSASTDYLGQFCHVYGNVANLESIIKISGIRFGIDYITGLLNIIPGLSFQSSYEFTSQFHFGSEWMFEAGVPIDYITLGYIEFSFLGIIITAFLLGYVCFIIDHAINQLSDRFDIIKNTLIISFFNFFINADFGVLVKSQFLLTICGACILFSLHVTKQPSNSEQK